MEFLLINHPLDCPICDQGGECQLQDLAVGYGASSSRYTEAKRVVANKNLGPLDFHRHDSLHPLHPLCAFGQEIAGIMELGHGGSRRACGNPFIRRQHGGFRISGNMIDLCPVGALVSKPFRYSARTWELSRRKSMSPHCGLGSNLMVQVKQNRVMRVLPRENEEINECWLSDKDRFLLRGVELRGALEQADDTGVMGQWQECDWQTALEFVANWIERRQRKIWCSTYRCVGFSSQHP